MKFWQIPKSKSYIVGAYYNCYIVSAYKNCLDEAVLLSTHTVVCFDGKKKEKEKKMFSEYYIYLEVTNSLELAQWGDSVALQIKHVFFFFSNR